ncbi:hypothetical protein SS1G_14168 [Sclerotinia sclerotiorum 1980 UF-70]|uniref:Cytochrome P450 n=1 Tax=Sclerotinia sclerotiorum (strain ATCC 18683 / 1980 / Ss-1) TaxID=665079 RepID=A7F987_SCLS1|nr:hypothetical protein SS1G_14168 [Sclerotinia sclerotiorum 1980 UF-70]EDO00298.1 hypothetical protein SS1G_14168 [Sclerotinia sclerotiorum 1980 UF-70]
MLQELFELVRSQASAWRITSEVVFDTCVILIILNRLYVTTSIYRNRPRNILISGPKLRWGKWLSSIKYVFNAPDIIQKAYDQAKGEPFAIPALDEYQVFVSSEEHIAEVNESSQDHLSLHDAMEDRVKAKYTFYGFEQGTIDPHDTVPGRVLKFLLRTNQPALRPKIQQKIEEAFSQVLSKGKVINDYVDAVLRYSNDVILSMEFCRYMPAFIIPYACPAIMAWSGAMEKLATHIRPLVIQRLRDIEEKKTLPSDCITWVIESSTTPKQRTVERIVQQMIALTFASAHQLPLVLTFTIYNLCLHPEYIEPLTEEIRTMLSFPEEKQYKNMPLMESFLRESARMNPLDALSIQRKVMKPFTFSSGQIIPKGNIIAVPQDALMKSPRYYNDPETFDGFRFVLPEDRGREEPRMKYTDVNTGFPFWGASKKACPGRWYVSASLKQILAHLLTNYEFKLADDSKKLTMGYTTMVIPRHGTRILLRKLEKSG